ncbi:MAG: flagellar basal body rod protein FlgC [Planctomycetes bacterium]|nr:flagellar basal body rod protein FlgC [Planctomycetota bacterium]
MFGSLDISTSALVAQRARLDTIAGNIANAYTTRRADGQAGPYQRRFVVVSPGDGKGGPGAHVERVMQDPSPGRMLFEPDHPDAIGSGRWKGYVEYPNVEPITEMTNAMMASRAYEANIAAMDVTKRMIASSLRLLA